MSAGALKILNLFLSALLIPLKSTIIASSGKFRSILLRSEIETRLVAVKSNRSNISSSKCLPWPLVMKTKKVSIKAFELTGLNHKLFKGNPLNFVLLLSSVYWGARKSME